MRNVTVESATRPAHSAPSAIIVGAVRNPESGKAIIIDCETGRALGCETFCCRLLVRLDPGERDPGKPDAADKLCVDKTPDGRCVCLDPDTGRCTEWAARPRICREYDCNADPLLQVVLRDGFRSLTELVHSPKVSGHEHMHIPPMEGDDIEPGQGRGPAHELVRLRQRLEAQPAPERCGDAELECAAEMLKLRLEITRAIGAAEACASCACGEPPPVGRFEGGKCCSHPVSTLYDDSTLGSLAASFTTPRDLRGPYTADGGCVFRGPAGCVIAAEHRPNACVAYLCEELERELEQRGDLGAVRDLCRSLEAAAARFAALTAMRELAEKLEGLL